MTTKKMRAEPGRRRATALAALALGPLALGAAALVAGSPLAGAATGGGKAEVQLAKVAKYGNILETSSGLPLYFDTANKPGKWACTGACLSSWPALVLPKGATKVTAGAGVTGLGTVKSPSGLQVTWHGKALYTFARDSKGKVNGQGLGHVWYVAQVAAAAGGVTTTTKAGSWA